MKTHIDSHVLVAGPRGTQHTHVSTLGAGQGGLPTSGGGQLRHDACKSSILRFEFFVLGFQFL